MKLKNLLKHTGTLIFLIISLIKLTINQQINPNKKKNKKDCPPEMIKCVNSGICVDNFNKCPTPMNCSELKKVNQYTCSKIETFFESINCDGYTCWNNQCVSDSKECPTMISCPPGYNKCHDNSCVKTLDQCPKYMTCPKFIPVRCPNGDCRRNLEDCPSLIKCPANRPILCNDNSCKATSIDCLFSSVNTKCSGKSMVRCGDGTCKSSKFLCGTPKTCPIGKKLCPQGFCSDSFETCLNQKKNNDNNSCGSSENPKVRCQDNTCQRDINNCPTDVICPVERPVRCWDNSCKENILQCPKYQNCPDGLIDCPNGTCSIDLKCGTLVTCPWEAPFKCMDNTCKRNPQDCLWNSDCPLEKPILCWDGSCVKNRNECIKPSTCELATPVKCPDNSCRKNVEECREISGCPIGFVKCSDLSCKRKSADCEQIKCPHNFPNNCPNGICVKNKNHCEMKNGCPYYAQIKCPKSPICVDDINKCNQVNNKTTKKNKQQCPDGSYMDLGLTCPLENGCPRNKPNLCGNNRCRKNCNISKCPIEAPIKCLSGLCTNTISNCPSDYDFNRYEKCNKKNLISCHNGQCAKYQEECKPTFSCPKDMNLCNDGSCRYNKEECPIENTCPENFKFRCSNGTCEKSELECLNISGCPKNRSIKCITNGYCVSNTQECKNYDKKFPIGNGCDNFRPYKCLNGKCAFDKNSCEDEKCEPGKYYCTNSGKCENSKGDCRRSICDKFYCKKYGVCVESPKECPTTQGCTLENPNRCLDGQCRKYPFEFNSESDILFCSLGIQCPPYRPYLCADGSCMEKSSFCKSLRECPSEKNVRCPDRSCVARYEDCKFNKSNISCPEKNPILCNNSGNCVKNYFDCFDEKCPDILPIKCSSGRCVSSPRECIYSLAKEKSDKKFEDISGCTGSQEICFDGSCRNTIEECPIYSGCNNPKYPYKCQSGKCAINSEECDKDIKGDKIEFIELLSFDCKEKEKENPGQKYTLCNDGICRRKCPINNACDNKNPYLCTNGVCVKDIWECAGESKCPIGDPFKCVDGICRKNPSDCYKPKKLETSTDLKIFVYPQNNLNSDIVIDEYNNIISSINIPSNSFVKKEQELKVSEKQIISIKTIPNSFPRFKNTKKSYKDDVRDFILKLFPYGDKEDSGELEFKYAIVSPVLSIDYIYKNLEVHQNITLKMSYDLPSAEYIGNITNRVCLAYLPKEESTKWECNNDIISESNRLIDNFYSGKVEKEGYYAIAVDIDYLKEEKSEINSIYKYFKWIFLSILLLFGLLIILIYVLGRIWRYRQKYKKTQNEFIEMEKKEMMMKEKMTSFKGESVRDAEQNMIFTDNPCKEGEIDTNDEERKSRKVYLETLEDSYFQKIKKLESNNEKLGNERDNLMERLEKLREYYDLLKEGKTIFEDE